jgi:hypothetical protein
MIAKRNKIAMKNERNREGEGGVKKKKRVKKKVRSYAMRFEPK